LSFFLAGIRLLVYLDGSAAPISLLGRLATGRLVIRGYDSVFAAPLLALWAGVGVPIVLLSFGVGPMEAGSAALALSVLLALKVGPNLREWRLAGGQRLTSPLGSKAVTKTG
jgi:hypothetical protein